MSVIGNKMEGLPVKKDVVSNAVEVLVECIEPCFACVGRGKSASITPLEKGKKYMLEIEPNAFEAIKNNVKVVLQAASKKEPVVEKEAPVEVEAPIVKQEVPVAAKEEPAVKEEVKEPVVKKAADQVKKESKKK